MANYAISGVWKNSDGVITHYAIHVHNIINNTIGLATKTAKPQAVTLLDTPGNSGITILWNYNNHSWDEGTRIDVVGNYPNKYLRTYHDGTVRDNLAHLINYGMITNNFA